MEKGKLVVFSCEGLREREVGGGFLREEEEEEGRGIGVESLKEGGVRGEGIRRGRSEAMIGELG